jgi:signal transduction histidine kinase
MAAPERAWSANRTVGRIAGVFLAGLGLYYLLTTSVEPDAGIGREGDVIGAALALFVTLPLAVCDRFPRGVPTVIFTAFLVAAGWGYAVQLAGFAVLMAVALGVAETPPRDGIAIAAAGAVTLVVAVFITPGAVTLMNLVGNVLLVLMAAALGTSIREHRELADALAERARELDALREARTREAVAQERLRIARDVHDAVGHALAAVTLHVRLAQRALNRDPAACAQSLSDIAQLASGALAETRNAVGQIRAADDAALRPQRTLADLPELVDGVRVPGIDVVLEEQREGGAPALAVQATAFRIVQESLSNVVKHARPAHVRIRLESSETELRLEVRDDGKGVTGEWTPGNGLVGMRERAEAVGGTLEAGPAPDGGWRVVASLPISPGSP